MELTKAKICIINAGIGDWYKTGTKRLRRSLNEIGFPGDILSWEDQLPPNSPPHNEVPYYFKIAAFEWALYRQYTHVLWCDSSFWAVSDPMPIFDIMNEQGYYMFSSGYSLGQTANDKCLEYLEYNRDDLMAFPEWATGCVGINFENPTGRALYRLWKEYMDAGLSVGSRLHDNQSQDPRFKFHRQDQTCWSLACYKLDARNERGLDHVAYYGTGHNPQQLIFYIRGI
jgi:hypothetical protein